MSDFMPDTPADISIDEQRLSRTLTTFASEGVAEDMDLWPTIAAAAHTTRRVVRWIPQSRMGWAAMLLAGLLAVTATTYAISVLSQVGDPGIMAVAEEITYFNESQTQDNLSVTLEYAYADANRITVAYSGGMTFPVNEANNYTFIDVVLRDDQGNVFERIPFGGGGGGGGGGGSSQTVTLQFGENANFDASVIEGQPDMLNLELVLTVGVPERRDAGGGGSGGSQPVAPTPSPLPVREYEPIVFEFSVPFLAGKRLPGAMTATAGDVDVVLNQVIVTPSLTRFELCFDKPVPEDPDRFIRYVPDITLSIAGEVLIENDPLTGGREGSEQPCRTYLLAEGLYDQAGEWELTIHRLRLANSAPVEDLQAAFAAENLDVEVFDNGAFRAPLPEGEDPEVYYGRIEDIRQSLEFRVEGAWQYTFDLQP